TACHCVANATCGDGHVDAGETCDPPDPSPTCAQSAAGYCGTDCQRRLRVPACGDGCVDASTGEDCDGAGQAQCAADHTCTACHCVANAMCGDGHVDPGEDCDGAGQAQCAADHTCTACHCVANATCGDGNVDPGE